MRLAIRMLLATLTAKIVGADLRENLIDILMRMTDSRPVEDPPQVSSS
jgi:hypothetical protein